ncbi:MAG TPA: VWA domain-containing protein [Pyrinomonadaceae bacterium]
MNVQPNTRRSRYILFLCVITLWSSPVAQVTPNQNRQNPVPQKKEPQSQPPPAQRPSSQEEVVKVYTELVQTDVMVFDKKGRFVNGLTRDDFQLKVDGQLRPIQSFDLITAGSNEEAQLAAARGGASNNVNPRFPNRPVPLDRGRTVFFYVDDVHLDGPAMSAARKAISDFVDKEMGQNDQAGIATATGQVGFLQQLTSNPTVLHEAIERLKVQRRSPLDADQPPMSEYDAMLIDRNDSHVREFFIDETIRLNPGSPPMSREVASSIVLGRAQSIQSQAGFYNTYMLSGLENWIRSSATLPGRKVLFLLSNGFLIENNRSDSIIRMQRITAAAAKSGVVIYSLDVRGLVTEPGDLSRQRPFDPMNRLQSTITGELTATQDGMNALARDTGGKAIFNTNDLRQGVSNAVKETSTYYLLAWKPDSESLKSGRFRNIDVAIAGRPDLTVRVRRGFYDRDPATTQNPNDSSKTIATKLREAIVATFPKNDLPISLNTVYYDVAAKGPTVFTSIQIPGEFMTFGPANAKIQAVVDVTGVFYSLQGEPITNFGERIVTTGPNAEAAKDYRRDITYTYPAAVKPGLYQVRVAARDDLSGRIGTAHSWIEVPDLSKKQLAMSSLLLGERTQAMMNVNVKEDTPINQTASKQFRRESNLRFLVFVYNSQPSTTNGKPDVSVQVQIVRDNQPVITTALRKLLTDGVADLTRLPYAAEVSLNTLLPGRYILRVTVIDLVSKQSTSQLTHFEVY